MSSTERQRHLWEMITIAYPAVDGMISVQKHSEVRDDFVLLMKTIGFEFLVMHPVTTDELREEIDPNKNGKVPIDDIVQKLDDYVEELTDDSALEEAFGTFDADNDGMLSLEEFEFFMTGFAKNYSQLYERKMVKQMLAMVKEQANEEGKFYIRDIIRVFKEIWKEDD